jgi:two-component system sensor histidine kinase DegS
LTELQPVAATDPGAFADRIATELATLDSELVEIDLLIQQARSEADRHEMKRSQTADRVATLRGVATPNPTDLAEAASQLVQLTRRAVMMESQVDVLQGKQKALGRYREALQRYGGQMRELATSGGWVAPGGGANPTGAPGSGGGAADGDIPAAVSRIVLTAQEDLRRDIARAMHDGPAQSLTNIVLQAQIVDRLVDRDPVLARTESKALIAMVQTTLEATKSFIFDVRPMVLDDLGLVPTLRRTARERGRRAQIAVDFDSMGTDRRLAMELESGLFRMIDQALAGFLSTAPRRVLIRLDWGDQIEARVAAHGEAPAARPEPAGAPADGSTPAVPTQVGAAEAQASHVLPAKAWREIQQRASTLGIVAELLAAGTEVRLVASPTFEDGPAAGPGGPGRIDPRRQLIEPDPADG